MAVPFTPPPFAAFEWLIAWRYLRGVVDFLVVEMEKEAMKLVQAFDQLTVQAPPSRRREAAS